MHRGFFSGDYQIWAFFLPQKITDYIPAMRKSPHIFPDMWITILYSSDSGLMLKKAHWYTNILPHLTVWQV